MSKNLSSVAVIEFDSMVKHAYQGMGKLKDCVTVRNNVVGDTYKFRRMGKGLANQKSTADLVTPMDTSHEFKVATLGNWNAPEYTDIFDQAEVNFDEKSELANTISGAMGRRNDQIIIDALDAATPLTTTVDAGASNLGMAEVINAKTNLVDQGVGSDELFAVIESGGLKGLLNDTLATSADYQEVKALISGAVDSLVGFKFKILETRTEGGLTEAANKPDAWFFHKSAVGLAIGIDMKVEINYIADRTAWLTNGVHKSGAIVRDEGGIQLVQYTKTA